MGRIGVTLFYPNHLHVYPFKQIILMSLVVHISFFFYKSTYVFYENNNIINEEIRESGLTLICT